jgi:zinc transporter ZupT
VNAIPSSDILITADQYFSIAKRHGHVIAEHMDIVFKITGHGSHSRDRKLGESTYEGEHHEDFEAADVYYTGLANCPLFDPTSSNKLEASETAFTCTRVTMNPNFYETIVPVIVKADDVTHGVEFQYAVYLDDEEHDDAQDHPVRKRNLAAHLEHSEEEEVHYDQVFTIRSSATGLPFPVLQTASSDEEPAPAFMTPRKMEPIVASFIVNLATLIGIVFLVPILRNLVMKSPNVKGEPCCPPLPSSQKFVVKSPPATSVCNDDNCCEIVEKKDLELNVLGSDGAVMHTHNHSAVLVDSGIFSPIAMVCLSSFSGGCIFATAVFLVLPEAMHLIEGAVQEENPTAAHWGACILAGFLLPYVISFFTELFISNKTGSDSTINRRRLILGCLLGDAFHNFADGVFIGAAFLNCGSTFGWTVAIASVFHELAQETADFFILTGGGGLSPLVALILNFLSGSACIWGSIIIVYLGISDDVVGYIIAFGGGVYIQVGASECIPRATEFATTLKTKFLALFLFFVGALPIGLILLNHSHCEDSGGGGHSGH